MSETNGTAAPRGRGNFGPRPRGANFDRVLELDRKGDSNSEIARRLGISRQRVHQILRDARNMAAGGGGAPGP